MNRLDQLFQKTQAALRRAQAPERVAGAFVPTFAPTDDQRAVNAVKRLEGRIEVAEARAGSEIARICNLPVMQSMDPAEHEEFCRTHLLAEAFDSGFRLFPVQADAVWSYEQFGGLLAPIAVGWGKTLIGLMIANSAYKKGLRKILLLVPSEVLGQLVNHDIRWARTKVPFHLPAVFILGGKGKNARRDICTSGRKGLYILPYSLLSAEDAIDMIEGIAPELVICDEAHRVALRTAARTKRILRYIDHRKPEVVAMSGTITNKSVRDYWHLMRAALGQRSPLPLAANMTSDWADLLDAKASAVDGTSQASAGPLLPLVQWAQKRFPAEQVPESIVGFRRAYSLRLQTAPGVTCSGDADIGISLTLCNRPPEDNPSVKLTALIDKVNELFLTPNDDEIENAIHAWKWIHELSAGFYNQLTWPTEEDLAAKRSLSAADAAALLDRAKKYHAIEQEYAKVLRNWLNDDRKPGIDTPMLVGHSMYQDGALHVTPALYAAWKDMKAADFDGRPERIGSAIRVCSYKVDAAVRWARNVPEGERAIIWCYHQEMGKWMYDALLKDEREALYCPAGKQGNDAIVDEEATKGKIVVASITAHSTGKNLQMFQHQYFLQWPRQAKTAEQTLGRLHRNGQTADELFAYTNIVTEFDQLNFAACLNDALYVHQTTDNRQKLIYCNYDPTPKIFPSAVLYERGLETFRLNAEQERLMAEKFGR